MSLTIFWLSKIRIADIMHSDWMLEVRGLVLSDKSSLFEHSYTTLNLFVTSTPELESKKIIFSEIFRWV